MSNVDKDHVLTGECTVTLDDVDLGLTSEDGVAFGAEKTWVDVKGDQTLVTVKKRLAHIKRTIVFTLLEITPDALKKLSGYDLVGNKIQYAHIPDELELKIVGPAADDKVFTYITTVIAGEIGNVVRTKTGAVGLPVTFEEVGDPTDNTFGEYVEA
jgi:hypothetical protein